jgi:hypothetical protein
MNFIYKTIPKHTEEKVHLDQVIEIFFMIDLNQQSLREEHVILFNLTEQLVEPIQFSYNRRVLKVTPVSNLLPNNHYQFQIVGGEKGIRDITGRMMAQTYEVEFYTKDVQKIKPPTVLSPTDLTSVRESVQVELDSVVDADYYELQISKSNTFHNLVWPLDGEKVYKTSDVKLIPTIKYETGQYYLRVRSVSDDGTLSSWSSTVRYYYDGNPIIIEPEEPKMPSEESEVEKPKTDTSVSEEPLAEEPSVQESVEEEIITEESGEDVVSEPSKVILQASSRIQENPQTQLQKLQDIFSSAEGESVSRLHIKAVSPKDGSVNNDLSKVSTITIEFTDNIDPESITEDTCYVLSERN